MSLVARHLETAGIPTVILGSALDIVEHCGVPRYVFTDIPLGNPCGKPWDAEMQKHILRMGLELFEQAAEPRATVRSPYAWENESWRSRFMEVCDANREALLQKGEATRKSRAQMRE